jgi:hypothetical protein
MSAYVMALTRQRDRDGQRILEDVVARSGPAETHAMQEISGEFVVASDNAPEILEPAV